MSRRLAVRGLAALLGALTVVPSEALLAAEWQVGPWRECNNACGEGQRTRDVTCPTPNACSLPAPANSSSCRPTYAPDSGNTGLDYCLQCSPGSKTCDKCLGNFPLKDGKCVNGGRVAVQTFHVAAGGVLIDNRAQFVGVDQALKAALVMDGVNAQVTGEKGEACTSMRLVSAGFADGNTAEFYVGDGTKAKFNASDVGLNVMVLQLSADGKEPTLKSVKAYDFYNKAKIASAQLVADIQLLSVGDVVLVALKESGMENLDTAAIDALRLVGAAVSAPTTGLFRKGYALIGSKGRSVAHAEMVGGGKVEIDSVLCAGAVMRAALVPDADTDASLKVALQTLDDEDTNLLAGRILKSLGSLAPPNVVVSGPDSERFGVCAGLTQWEKGGCTVFPGPSPSPGPDGGKGGVKWWVWLLIALGVVLLAGIVTALVVRKRHAGPREASLLQP